MISIPIVLWINTFILSILGFNKRLPVGLVLFLLFLLLIGLRVGTIDYDTYYSIYMDINYNWENDFPRSQAGAWERGK
ncbi:MAG: hypothetical protein U9N59_08210 [Campylobacterota bacterium]|nr:hypothetical protein [Campylobacterota bacterium]